MGLVREFGNHIAGKSASYTILRLDCIQNRWQQRTMAHTLSQLLGGALVLLETLLYLIQWLDGLQT